MLIEGRKCKGHRDEGPKRVASWSRVDSTGRKSIAINGVKWRGFATERSYPYPRGRRR